MDEHAIRRTFADCLIYSVTGPHRNVSHMTVGVYVVLRWSPLTLLLLSLACMSSRVTQKLTFMGIGRWRFYGEIQKLTEMLTA